MRYRFLTCDVFTAERFGGNPLAVLPDARGLDAARMQRIAREFNYSESTFVTPGAGPLERRVRIFTPTREVPFAGHPNVGTAFVLASLGELGALDGETTVVFEEAAGRVPVSVRRGADGVVRCELEAPEPLSLGPEIGIELIAAALSLAPADIVATRHAPRVASVGLAFVVVELASVDALRRARCDGAALARIEALGITPDIHAYVRSGDDFELRTRMFAPFDGVPEDPATGSANCALVALLTHLEGPAFAGGDWRIAQGVEMGRPSELLARTVRADGRVRTFIGGASVMVCEGFIEVG